jgi:hypothetical protein
MGGIARTNNMKAYTANLEKHHARISFQDEWKLADEA